MAGQFIFFSPERQPNKELKIQKKYKSSSKNFQPGLQPNNEQKADEMHVTPSYSPMRMLAVV